jgi:hypothetical protein
MESCFSISFSFFYPSYPFKLLIMCIRSIQNYVWKHLKQIIIQILCIWNFDNLYLLPHNIISITWLLFNYNMA